MGVRRITDDNGKPVASCDYSRAKCVIHGGKLRDCGCSSLFVDTDWIRERNLVRMRRMGRVYGRAREKQIMEAVFGPSKSLDEILDSM